MSISELCGHARVREICIDIRFGLPAEKGFGFFLTNVSKNDGFSAEAAFRSEVGSNIILRCHFEEDV